MRSLVLIEPFPIDRMLQSYPSLNQDGRSFSFGHGSISAVGAQLSGLRMLLLDVQDDDLTQGILVVGGQ
jgi:hypothetical protein